MKSFKRLLLTMLLLPVFPVIWNDPPPAADPPPGDPPPAADPPPADDLGTLFTLEEVTAKKEALAAAQAEETRRAALTEEERTAEDAAKAEADKKAKAPEEYADFKLPDGFEVDKELLEIAIPIFKKAGLTQEVAQEFVDIQAKLVEKRSEQWEADKAARLDLIKADKEIGGDKLNETKEIANRFVNTFLNAEESKELSTLMGRFGDIPVLIKLLARAGKQIREGGIVQPVSSQAAGESERIAGFYSKSNMAA